MRGPRALALAFAAVLCAASVLAPLVGHGSGGPGHGPGPGAASAAGRWAPSEKARITPGVQMVTRGAQCTANFVFTDRRGRVYLGYAAHCAGKGAATDTNGCDARSHPLGTRVRFERGGTLVSSGELVGQGRLAYSSWLTMQRRGTRGPACDLNDFALVRLDRRLWSRVNPSVPHWGGPVGQARDGLALGEQVYTYGNSSLRGGVAATSPKTGVTTDSDPTGWGHYVYTATPGIPGDSGSGFLDSDGRAVGTLSTLGIAPYPGENGVGDLAHELHFAQRHSGIPKLRLVRGTEAFTG